MIPELVDDVLPEGVHPCTFEDLEAVFGRDAQGRQRRRLAGKLREFLAAARQSGIISAVIVDGSFVTGKLVPNDIDLVVAYRRDFDLRQELRPFEYNVLSRASLRRDYGFDAFIERDGSDGYLDWIEFFGRIRSDGGRSDTSRSRKGLLRIDL